MLQHSIALWALFGLLLPVLVHLWSKKKGAIIPFGSIYFLRDVEHEQLKSIHLTDLWLLLIRLLLLLAIVFLLADPLLKLANSKEYTSAVLYQNREVAQDYKSTLSSNELIIDQKDLDQFPDYWAYLHWFEHKHPEIDSLYVIGHFSQSDFPTISPAFNRYIRIEPTGMLPKNDEHNLENDTLQVSWSFEEESYAKVVSTMLNSLSTYSSITFEETTGKQAALCISKELEISTLANTTHAILFRSGLKRWHISHIRNVKVLNLPEAWLSNSEGQEKAILALANFISGLLPKNAVALQDPMEIQGAKVQQAKVQQATANTEWESINLWVLLAALGLLITERFASIQKANG